MTIQDKRKYLNNLKDICFNQSKKYKKRYRKLKFKDDMLDVATSTMTASVIAFTVSGFVVPPLLIASVSLTGLSFVIQQGQKTYNLKRKYVQHGITITQYDALAREIIAVLHRNHMTSIEYDEFIDSMNDKMALIDDTRII
ncbi:MAG: hypothetical protein GY920_16810 [Aliivibrio sp.]|nr:hypothetical protein [Aliivibrio sp.]